VTKDQLGIDPGVLPLVALAVFIVVSAVVALYILTDRRREHHRRMVRLALEEGGDHD
jgi:hypothetical protein